MAMETTLDVIGWMCADGVRYLVTRSGNTLKFNDSFIDTVINRAKEDGNPLPELYWTGSHFAEVIDV